jgi:hypothetical protein
MKIILTQLLNRFSQIVSSQESLITFLIGVLCGLLLVIAVCILLRIIVLLCRRGKKIPFLELPTDHGNVRISAAAISDLVHTVSNRHPALEAERAVLTREKGVLLLRVKAWYSAEGNLERSLVDCSKAFQEDVLATLEKAMGISTVEKVILTIPRCRI